LAALEEARLTLFDPADNWSIGMAPWIPMGRKELVPLGRTLLEFFTILQNDQRLGRI